MNAITTTATTSKILSIPVRLISFSKLYFLTIFTARNTLITLINLKKRVTLSILELENGKKFKITVTVKNTGRYDGKETVQLYINDKFASIMRPLRELKAFEKPFIKSGDTVQIDFELGYQDIGFYNENGDYIIESGEIDVFVGANCLTKNKITISIND